MFSMQRKLKERRGNTSEPRSDVPGRISVRDQLLTKEMQDLLRNLPPSCSVRLSDPDKFHEFHLDVAPADGIWRGGTFDFFILVPLEYNIVPPKVTCKTRLWHPNITEDGQVCLSLLRGTSLDGMGWAPTRTLKDVAYGVSALFDELLNFDDPLNLDAANEYASNKDQFIRKAAEYVAKYASKR